MLVGTSYASVRALAGDLGISPADEALWSDTTYIRRLLPHYGLHAAPDEKPFTSWADLPDRALLATKYRVVDARPFWHWIVFSREADGAVALDPAPYLACNRRTDWEAMDVAWSIAIDGV